MLEPKIPREELIKEYMQDYLRLLSLEKNRLKEKGYDVHYQEIRIWNIKRHFLD